MEQCSIIVFPLNLMTCPEAPCPKPRIMFRPLRVGLLSEKIAPFCSPSKVIPAGNDSASMVSPLKDEIIPLLRRMVQPSNSGANTMVSPVAASRKASRKDRDGPEGTSSSSAKVFTVKVAGKLAFAKQRRNREQRERARIRRCAPYNQSGFVR